MPAISVNACDATESIAATDSVVSDLAPRPAAAPKPFPVAQLHTRLSLAQDLRLQFSNILSELLKLRRTIVAGVLFASLPGAACPQRSASSQLAKLVIERKAKTQTLATRRSALDLLPYCEVPFHAPGLFEKPMLVCRVLPPLLHRGELSELTAVSDFVMRMRGMKKLMQRWHRSLSCLNMRLQAAASAASAAAFQALLCRYWLLRINAPAAHSHISCCVNAQRMVTSFADL